MANLEDQQITLGRPRGNGVGVIAPPPTEADAWIKSVPFFGTHVDVPDMRIRVKWHNPATNFNEELGYIGVNCGQDELLHSYPKAGRFELWLESTIDGKLVADRPQTIVIADDHRTLQQIRASRAAATTVPGGQIIVQDSGGGQAMQQLMALLEIQRTDLAEERRRVQEDRLKVEELSRGAVAIMTDRSAAVNDKVLEQSAALAAKGQEALTGSFTGLLAMMQAQAASTQAQQQMQAQAALAQQQQAADTFLARMSAQAENERRQAELRIQEVQQRAALEIEAARERTKQEQIRADADAKERRERDERAAAERKDDMERREKERTESFNQERERQREHNERLLKMEAERRDPLTSMAATLTTIAALGEKVGIDLPGLLKGGGEKSGGIIESLIGMAGPALQTFIKARAGVAAVDDEDDEEEEAAEQQLLEDPNQIVRVQMEGTNQIVEMTRAQYNRAQQGLPPTGGAPNAAVPAPAPILPAGHVPPAPPAPPLESAPPWGGSKAVTPEPALAASSIPQPPSPAEATMTKPDLKAARAACRQIVAKLGTEPESSWEGTLMVAVLGNPLVFAYLKAVTLEGALTEVGTAGSNPALAARILVVAEASGKIDKKFIRKGVN